MSAARKERREAERRAAKAKKAILTEKHNCSLAHLDSIIGLEKIAPLMREMVERYGVPPTTTLEIAAAHEAGHLIVGLALGGKFAECYIEQRAALGWVGYNRVFVEGVHTLPGESFKPVEDPERAFAGEVQRYGGIAAEIIIDAYHPCSSLEESTSVLIVSAAIGHGKSKPVFDRIQSAAIGIISANWGAFNHARQLLEQKHRLTSDDAEIVVAMLEQSIDRIALEVTQ